MKNEQVLPSKNFFDQYFTYDSDAGVIYWKPRPRSFFDGERAFSIWNKRFQGKPAGTVSVNKRGYKRKHINVEGHRFLYHRVCMILAGYKPSELYGKLVDHINQDATDNRIKNLRIADCTKNARNRSIRKDNKSGLSGVGYCKRNKNWYCSIGNTKDGERYTFKTIFDAACYRKSTELEMQYSPNHGQKH